MRRLAHSVAAMLLVVTALGAMAQVKFRSSGANGGTGRYRVSVRLQAGDELETISRQLAATYGGRLEPYAEQGFDGFAIEATETRARLLSGDRRVVLVEEMESSGVVAQPSSTASMEHVTSESSGPPIKIATEAISGFGTYTYDGSGNITSIGDATARDTFLYDELGRLKSAALRDGPGQSYTYDRYGNILTIVTVGDSVTKKLGVDKNTNQIDQPNDENGQPNNVVGTYDARGNLISYGSGTFVYDGLDMMKEASVDGVRRFHIYSASDERVLTIKTVGSSVVGDWTIRDPGGRVLRRFTETNGTFAWTEDYIYRGGELLATAVPGPEKIRHFHLDHLGTPRLVTGNGGAQIAQHHYQPFGPELTSSTNDGEKAKFTGHERDASTLDYMHARYYDPFMGRFLSVDPGKDWDMSQPQSWNMYSYVRNNPINKTDPTGKWVFPWEALDYAAYQQSSREWTNSFYAFTGNPTVATATTAAINFVVAAADAAAVVVPAIPAVGGHTQRVATEVATRAATKAERLAANKAKGDAFRDQLAAGLKAEGRDVKTEVVKNTPFGPRRVDIEVSQNGTVLGAIETKTGNSPYTPSQRAKDYWLRVWENYIVDVVRQN